MNRRGSLLLETIFAVFILLIGVVVFAGLFQQSSRMSNSQAQLYEQIALAEATIADIKQWAQDPAHFDSDWSAWEGRTIISTENSSVTAEVHVDGGGRDLLSPSAELEGEFAGPIQRTINKAVVPVEVTVTSSSLKPLRLTTLVASPVRVLGANPRVVVTTVSGSEPIPQNGITRYSASLNSGGDPVPNVTFEWYLIPRTGNANLIRSTFPRNGSFAEVQNHFKLPGGDIGFASGQVLLRVRARYHGRFVENGDPPDKVVDLL